MPAPENGGAGVSVEEIRKPIEKPTKFCTKRSRRVKSCSSTKNGFTRIISKSPKRLNKITTNFRRFRTRAARRAWCCCAKRCWGIRAAYSKRNRWSVLFRKRTDCKASDTTKFWPQRRRFLMRFCFGLPKFRKMRQISQIFRLCAQSENIVKRYANDNVYVYYVLKRNPVLSEKLKHYMDNHGLSYDDVDYAFRTFWWKIR